MDPKLTRGPFKFNLLPPKSEVEVVLELERDDSVLYSMLLVFVAGLAFFGVTMVNTLLVNPRVAEFESAVKVRQQQIDLFSDIRSQNGELFVKTRTLAPVLQKKIDSNQIFTVADKIAANPGVNISSYGRERSGLFVFQVTTSSINELSGLVEAVNKIEGVSQVLFRSTRFKESDSKYLTTLALNIDA